MHSIDAAMRRAPERVSTVKTRSYVTSAVSNVPIAPQIFAFGACQDAKRASKRFVANV
jgi:hypothetical protein